MNSKTEKDIALIFDLDYTLWPFWADTHVNPPFHKDSQGIIRDAYNYKIQTYPEVYEILDKLKSKGYILCSISRTESPEVAKVLLEMTGLKKYFKHSIFDVGSKISGIKSIIKEENLNGLKYTALFDDEDRNISDAKRNGVFPIKVNDEYGITKELVNQKLKEMHQGLGIPFNDLF